MHAIKSLVIVALAATVSAAYFNGELLRREVLQARQTPSFPSVTATASTNNTNACSSVLQGLATLVTGLPTPTGALSTYLATAATTLTDPCHLSVPSSIAPAFSTYESSVISFYSANSAQLNSALAACPSLTSLVANPVCSSSTAGAASTTATATVTSSVFSSSLPPKIISTAGANGPRETGMVAAALLAAGLFAVAL